MKTNSSSTLPIARRLLTQEDVKEILGARVFRDAFTAGWIRPRTQSRSRGPSVTLYALSDVRAVEDRLLNGEYPGPS